MQQDEYADPGTYDDGDTEFTRDEGSHMNSQTDNDDRLKLGTNEAFDDDTMNAHASPDEDDKLPEDLLLALGQWASRICYVCQSFLNGTSYSEDDYVESNTSVYHASLISLRQSVHAGCPLCRQLSISLDRLYKESELRAAGDAWHVECTVHIVGNIIGASSGMHLLFFLFDDEGHVHPKLTDGSFANMEFYAAKDSCLGPEFLDPSLDRNTAKSEASIDLVRSWYQRCTCRNWQPESRVLPSRLVQVWRPDPGVPDILCAKLCESENLPPTATPYTTLSHRWGPSTFLKLQKSNRRELQQAIPVNQLLQVFKDAMHITIELNVSYIWIDSLCIIQDCKEDWALESKTMGNVYQYGELNIAATGYDDGDKGLFGMRDPIPSNHFPIHLDCDLRGLNGEHFNGFYIKASKMDFVDDVIRGPLNSRGWVAQERALSPAIVHYTPKVTWWECGCMIANEAFPSGQEEWDRERAYTPWQVRSLGVTEKEPIYDFWRRFIGFYAGTKITFEKDRFPAATGIARILGKMLNERFIAGFWEGDIVRSLLWNCCGEASIPSAQVAPSWSWASMCVRIGGYGFETKSSARRRVCRLLSGVDLEVLSTVDGFTSDLEAMLLEKSSVWALAVRGPLRTLPHDLSAENGGGTNVVYFVEVKEDKDHITSHLQDGGIPHEQAWRLNASTHLLPLAQDYLVVYGLLIQHVPEAPDLNTFRRSGKVTFCFQRLEMIDEYFGIFEKDGKYEPSLRFEECGLQNITLI